MKLNYDCMRDILLAIEETNVEESISFNALKSNLKYNKDEIWYSCHLLYENGYITAVCIDEVDNAPLPLYPCINELTLQGHELLNAIRNETIWKKAKEKAKKLGVASIAAISQIAINILTEKLS